MTNTAAEIDPLIRSLSEPGSVTPRAACRSALTAAAPASAPVFVSPITTRITAPFAPARDTQHEKV